MEPRSRGLAATMDSGVPFGPLDPAPEEDAKRPSRPGKLNFFSTHADRERRLPEGNERKEYSVTSSGSESVQPGASSLKDVLPARSVEVGELPAPSIAPATTDDLDALHASEYDSDDLSGIVRPLPRWAAPFPSADRRWFPFGAVHFRFTPSTQALADLVVEDLRSTLENHTARPAQARRLELLRDLFSVFANLLARGSSHDDAILEAARLMLDEYR